MKPKPLVPTAQWVESEFRLPVEGADKPGPYDLRYAPYLLGIYNALDDPEVSEVYTSKAAQIGWTFGLIGYIGAKIDNAPCPIIVMFPKEGAAREFNDEKFTPSVRSTPALAAKIDVSKSRSADNRALFKKFAGGFLKFVSGQSISSVKSTPAKIVIVEEPDDAVSNLKEQGNAIKLLFERTKRITGSKRVLGGTPSIKGLSKVESHIEKSDRRSLPVVCHDCGESHVLAFGNVHWVTIPEDEREGIDEHEIYGYARPETAMYGCPHCGSCWDDYQRKENIRNTVFNAHKAGDKNAGFVATAEFHGAAGFENLSELYSCLPGAGTADLVRDHLEAESKAAKGDETDKIVFTNSKLGVTYEFKGDNATADQIQEVAEDYPLMIVPRGGLLITFGIDLQHDRIAIIIRAWGRGEESWLIYWDEIKATNGVSDTSDPVWNELEDLVFGDFKHHSGVVMRARAGTIDTSDGNTNDAAYAWVRKMNKKHSGVDLFAGKGSSSTADPEIFVRPSAKSIDHKSPSKLTKADKYGLRVYQVGTSKAKNLIANRIADAKCSARMHHPIDVRADYYKQVTGEIKAPHAKSKKKVWQPKAGAAIEAWDCEVYALHAARAVRVHLKSDREWDAIERDLLQGDLFGISEPNKKILKEKSNKKTNNFNKFIPEKSGKSSDPYLD